MPARRVLVVALVLASACAKKSKPDSATPASDSTMPQSIDELEVELGRYEAELRTMGFAGDKKDEERANIIAYLKRMENQPSQGGLTLGALGPVTEGLWAWVAGVGGCVVIAVWLAARGARSR